jgi:GTPase SAR1 family protein
VSTLYKSYPTCSPRDVEAKVQGLTNEDSYDDLESWFDAVQEANSRKGSAPLPIIVVGSKLDLASKRAVKLKDLEFPKNKGLPYLEISSKANYKTKELLLGLVRALMG